MRTIFIYHPKSGDRVFATKIATSMAIIQWDNGCRHISGEIAVLNYETAKPNYHWRQAAKRVAADIVNIVGGITYDEGGTIVLIVPTHQWSQADRIMRMVRPYSDLDEDEKNSGAGHLAGGASLVEVGGKLIFQPTHTEPARVTIEREGSRFMVLGDENRYCGEISSPWSVKEILGVCRETQSQE